MSNCYVIVVNQVRVGKLDEDGVSVTVDGVTRKYASQFIFKEEEKALRHLHRIGAYNASRDANL